MAGKALRLFGILQGPVLFEHRDKFLLATVRPPSHKVGNGYTVFILHGRPPLSNESQSPSPGSRILHIPCLCLSGPGFSRFSFPIRRRSFLLASLHACKEEVP